MTIDCLNCQTTMTYYIICNYLSNIVFHSILQSHFLFYIIQGYFYNLQTSLPTFVFSHISPFHIYCPKVAFSKSLFSFDAPPPNKQTNEAKYIYFDS